MKNIHGSFGLVIYFHVPYKKELLIILDESKKYITVKDKIIKENFNKNKFGLTEKEAETAELAEKLFISENTVKLRLKNIFIKLNIKSRSKLRKYTRNGCIFL